MKKKADHTSNNYTGGGLLDSILSSAKDAIIMIDDRDLVRLWSKAAETIFGYTADEMMGKEFHTLVALPEYMDTFGDKFAIFRKTGEGDAVGKTRELRGRRKSGEVITVELSLNSIKIDGAWHAIGMVRDVSERKALEGRLTGSEAFFRNIYDNMDLAIFVIDILADGGYVLVGINPAHERRTGLINEKVRGRKLEEFLDPRVSASVRRNYDLCVQSGVPIEYEECIRFQGADTWWITNLMPVKDEHGRIYRILGASLSITERKALEGRVRDAFEFSEKVISNSPLGIATFRESGECVSVNDAYIEIIGAPDRKTSLAMNFHNLQPWKDSGQYERALKALGTGMSRSAVIHMTTIFGRDVWLNTRLVPFSVKGEPHLLVMMDDITQMKKSEMAAREGMMFVNSLIDTIPNPVFYNDSDGRYIGCNRAFEEFLGLSKMKIIGRTVFDIFPPDIAEIHDRMDRELTANPHLQVYEAKVKEAGGSLRDIQFHKAVFTAEGDITAGIIGVMLDVTERKKTEEMFREMSLVDALTGLGNRRNFDDMLRAEWNRCRRNSEPLSLLIIDIDFFKGYNDTYGHQAGDRCLAAVAAAIRESAGRGGDFSARYGGEEFAVILSDTPLQGALIVAERIRMAVAGLGVPHSASTAAGVVTVSVGAASEVPSENREPGDLITMADAALYSAKGSGRNRVES